MIPAAHSRLQLFLHLSFSMLNSSMVILINLVMLASGFYFPGVFFLTFILDL